MTYASTNEAIEALAAEIGNNVYIDVAKWHLYLRDAHLHTVLAERLYPMLSNGDVDESRVMDVLETIPVSLGGGKREIPLAELVPGQCQINLMEVLDEYQRRL